MSILDQATQLQTQPPPTVSAATAVSDATAQRDHAAFQARDPGPAVIETVSLSGQPVRPRHRYRAVLRGLRRLTGVVLVIALWQVLSSSGRLPPTVVGPPMAVLRAARHLIADGELGSAVATSLQRVALGVLLGAVVGISLALISGLSRLGEDVVDAPVQMLRTVPFAGVIPLLIIWLGVGETPKIVLIALGVTFPLYLNLTAGIRAVDPALVEAGRTLGLSRFGLIRNVILPSALPQLLTGLRFALGISWLALVFAEQISATSGLGYLMISAQELLQTDTIVVCLVVYALLGLAVDLAVRILERLLLAWRPRAIGA
ncbi:ABC transporter permease [Jatrophihabitans sp. DSM 45814]